MKLVPNVNPSSAVHFCKKEDGTPYTFHAMVDDDCNVVTGFLRIGRKVDLLGISFTDEQAASGLIDCTDSIDPDVRLSAVAIGTPDGVVKGIIQIPEVTPMAHMTYVVQGNMRLLALNFESHDFKFEGKKIHLALSGSINLQTGTAEVVARGLDDGLAVIGYTLDAERVNSNRRRIPA